MMSKVVVMLKTINIVYLCFLCVGPPLVAGGRGYLDPGKEDKVYPLTPPTTWTQYEDDQHIIAKAFEGPSWLLIYGEAIHNPSSSFPGL